MLMLPNSNSNSNYNILLVILTTLGLQLRLFLGVSKLQVLFGFWLSLCGCCPGVPGEVVFEPHPVVRTQSTYLVLVGVGSRGGLPTRARIQIKSNPLLALQSILL